MKVVCNYADLMAALSDVFSVVDDSLTQEDKRVICFHLENGGVDLIGKGRLVSIKRKLDSASVVEGENEVLVLKGKELLGFLNSYKSLRRTKVDEVIFENINDKRLKCTVVEVEAKSEDEMFSMFADGENKKMTSSWVFDIYPVDRELQEVLKMKFPESGGVLFSSENLRLYTTNLLPLMQTSTNNYGYLNFGDDFAVVFSQAFVVFVRNLVMEGDIFKNMRLQYRGVAYIDRMANAYESLEFQRDGRMLYLRTPVSEAYIMVDENLPLYKPYTEQFKKDHVVTIDRIYLKDVLRRLNLLNDNIEVVIKAEEGIVSLHNSRFGQDVDIHYSRGMEELPNVRFKIMPDVIDHAIIGADERFILPDNEYGSDTFIYYCKAEAGGRDNIIFSDATGGWFSVALVKPY